MSKLRTRLALTVVGAALLLSALVLLDQHEAAASDTLPSRGPAAVPGAPPVHNPSNRAWVDPLNSPQEQSAKPIATVQSLASTEPQVPVGAASPPASLPCRMCAQRKRRQPRLPRLLQPVAIRQRLTWLPTLIGLAPRSNRAISPPRAGCLSEPQTVTRLRLGLRWPKPTNRRCWPAGGSLASSRTSKRPGPCTRGLRRAGPKARESVCSLSDSKARPRTPAASRFVPAQGSS